MQPTKAQWDVIAEQLDRQYSPVYLRCDGFLVRAEFMRIASNKLGIVVSVNGWQYKGVWLVEGWEQHEEPRRFWRPVRRRPHSAKMMRFYERFYGKRECKKRGLYEPFVRPDPVWLRPRPFIAHLRKHNQRIEVIDYETYKVEVAAAQAIEKQIHDQHSQSVA